MELKLCCAYRSSLWDARALAANFLKAPIPIGLLVDLSLRLAGRQSRHARRVRSPKSVPNLGRRSPGSGSRRKSKQMSEIFYLLKTSHL